MGEHLGMNEKHPQLGSKMGVNTEGHFSPQQLNGAAPSEVPSVTSHELPVLGAQSSRDLVYYKGAQQSAAPAAIPFLYHFFPSSNACSLSCPQTAGRERSWSYERAGWAWQLGSSRMNSMEKCRAPASLGQGGGGWRRIDFSLSPLPKPPNFTVCRHL